MSENKLKNKKEAIVLHKKEFDFDFSETEDDFGIEDEIDITEEGTLDVDKEHYFSEGMFIRLKMALDIVKKFYSDLRNEMRRYDKITFRSNNSGDVYLLKGKVILKVTVYSRALKIYLAMNPKDFEEKLKVTDVSDIKKYEDLPSMVRVSSDRSYKCMIEVLAKFSKKYRLDRTADINLIDYERDCLSNSQELLRLLGYHDLLVKTVTNESCNVLPKNIAKNATILQTNPSKMKGSKQIAEVTIGELSAAFKSNYEIDLSLLKEVGVASPESNYLKIIAKGDCKHKLSVIANDYDIESLKMIILTGGNAIKYV